MRSMLRPAQARRLPILEHAIAADAHGDHVALSFVGAAQRGREIAGPESLVVAVEQLDEPAVMLVHAFFAVEAIEELARLLGTFAGGGGANVGGGGMQVGDVESDFANVCRQHVIHAAHERLPQPLADAQEACERRDEHQAGVPDHQPDTQRLGSRASQLSQPREVLEDWVRHRNPAQRGSCRSPAVRGRWVRRLAKRSRDRGPSE
jgi:hypothetical protein